MATKNQILEAKNQIFYLRYAAKHAEDHLPVKLRQIEEERKLLDERERKAYADKDMAPTLRLRAEYIEHKLRYMLHDFYPVLTRRDKIERRIEKLKHKLRELKQEIPDEFFTSEEV